MITVVRAFDRMPLAEVADDDEVALERKLDTADRIFGNRDGFVTFVGFTCQ